MADHLTPTVIQPPIPIADMTPLERLVLGAVFEVEIDQDALYLYSPDGPGEQISIPMEQLRTAFIASSGISSSIHTYIAKRIAGLAGENGSQDQVELDLSEISWEFILQDVVRRSKTLERVSALSAFTCSRMQPDGFGGMAVLITPDAIKGKSTWDMLEELIEENDAEPGTAASHVLLRFDEAAVRAAICGMIDEDPELTRLAPEITEADIRQACRRIAEQSDLSEERGSAEFRAALAAIRAAEQRQAAAFGGGR